MTFYIHASNIHTGASETYGPFPGVPGFTYEFMRCLSDEPMPPDDHIFMYFDGLPDGTLNIGDHWHDQEGEIRTDGWRRCKAINGSFGNETGPFWTDLSIDTAETPYQPCESNVLTEASPKENSDSWCQAFHDGPVTIRAAWAKP